jgi:hypothetical protein
MSFVIQFPEPDDDRTVETPLMVRTVRRTMAVHGGNGIVVWTGPSRNGKSFTASWMVSKIEEACDRSPHGFRAVHYEAGEIPDTWTGTEQKRGIRSLWHAAVGKMPDTMYRQYPPEALARELVHALQALNIQMILVDEAGMLSLGAMRGMTLVIDTAGLQKWPLTLVFIGMDNLPTKVRTETHIHRRVHEWCYFEPYSLEDTLVLAAALHPHFATLDLAVPAHHAQLSFIHEHYGGLPGLIVPFIRRLAHMEQEALRVSDRKIDLAFLRAVHMRTHLDEQKGVRDAEGVERPQRSGPKRSAKPSRRNPDAKGDGSAGSKPKGPGEGSPGGARGTPGAIGKPDPKAKAAGDAAPQRGDGGHGHAAAASTTAGAGTRDDSGTGMRTRCAEAAPVPPPEPAPLTSSERNVSPSDAHRPDGVPATPSPTESPEPQGGGEQRDGDDRRDGEIEEAA